MTGSRHNTDHFEDLPQYATAVRNHSRMLRIYLEDAKSNYQTVSPELRRQICALPGTKATDLHSCNPNARIRFAETILEHLEDHSGIAASPQLFFVTLTPNIFAMLEPDAPRFDAEQFRAWATDWLEDINFIGMIEPAYYPAWMGGEALIHFHAHGIAWGLTYSQLNRVLGAIRARHKSLIRDVGAAIPSRITHADLIAKALYFAKVPRKKYTRSMWTEEVVTADGEVVRRPTGKVKQNVSQLRPGEAIRVCKALENQWLDGLLFGSGDGVELASRICLKARGPQASATR